MKGPGQDLSVTSRQFPVIVPNLHMILIAYEWPWTVSRPSMPPGFAQGCGTPHRLLILRLYRAVILLFPMRPTCAPTLLSLPISQLSNKNRIAAQCSCLWSCPRSLVSFTARLVRSSGLGLFSQMLKRWPREGLRGGNPFHWTTQRVSQHSPVSTIYRVMTFFVTEAVRLGPMI